jgi:hypothetical protein
VAVVGHGDELLAHVAGVGVVLHEQVSVLPDVVSLGHVALGVMVTDSVDVEVDPAGKVVSRTQPTATASPADGGVDLHAPGVAVASTDVPLTTTPAVNPALRYGAGPVKVTNDPEVPTARQVGAEALTHETPLNRFDLPAGAPMVFTWSPFHGVGEGAEMFAIAVENP